MQTSPRHTQLKSLIPIILLVILLWLSYQVLGAFLLSLIWAFILAYVTWPLYQKVLQKLQGQRLWSATLMTTVISVIILGLIYGLAGLLQNEIRSGYQVLYQTLQKGDLTLAEEIRNLPGVGHYFQHWIDQINQDKAKMMLQAIDWLKQWLGNFATFLGSIGHYFFRLAIVLVTLFFCYRDGDEAINQLRKGLLQFLGDDQDVYLKAAGHTTRAVVYGMVLAALSQGLLAGVGYAFAGVQAPVLFGAITALLALVPMGATLVWVPIGIALILTGHIWAGAGLLIWGITVVSTVDNVIRPIVISGASKVPFLIVMFGVLGGLTAFGAIGIFLGPVILAVLQAVWQQWLKKC
jgi:Ca2+-transporting ATPase